MRRYLQKGLALIAALAIVAAGCGDDGDDSTSPGQSSTVTAEAGEPKRGGTVTFAVFSAGPGLDPATQPGSGTVGGIELAAIYDTLVRYDRETQSYEMGTAESLEANDDYTSWTLKVREGISFADRTPYNAEAVKFAIDRILTEGHSLPKNTLTGVVAATTVVDELTVRFDLKYGFEGFPNLLTNSAGFIYSPTAFAKAGSAENFNLSAEGAGAGPFLVKSFRPGASLELVRNPDYWGGEVMLDGLKFVQLPGADAALLSLEAGEVQAAFVRDPQVLAAAREKGFGAVVMPAPAGNMINMNSGIVVSCNGGKPEPVCAGQPDGERVPTMTATSDVRVRRAVAAAIDPEVVNERVWAGTASVGTAPFANTPWDPKAPGPAYDLDEAKRLVEEAKADGWDGRIRLLSTNDPTGREWGVVIKTQLELAGMTVELDTSNDGVGITQKVLVQRDFDLTSYSFGMNDEAGRTYLKLAGAFGANGQPPQFGYTSDEMLQALDKLRVASTPEQREATFGEITEVWTRDVPAVPIAEIPEAVVHASNLHGIRYEGAAIVLFDKAWLER